MIKSFADKGTEAVANGLSPKRYPKEILRRAQMIFSIMEHSSDVMDFRTPPGNRLKKMKPPFQSYWRIRVNDAWRVVFQFQNNEFFDVKLTEDHDEI